MATDFVERLAGFHLRNRFAAQLIKRLKTGGTGQPSRIGGWEYYTVKIGNEDSFDTVLMVLLYIPATGPDYGPSSAYLLPYRAFDANRVEFETREVATHGSL